jgi:hypothetical protein
MNLSESYITLQPGDVEENILSVPVVLYGENVLSSDFVCEYDPNLLNLIDITETNDFQLFYLEKEKGTVRIGLFRPEPVSLGEQLLSLNFQIKEETENNRITLRNVFINDFHYQDVTSTIKSVPAPEMPRTITLFPNYPNPFNGRTTIRYHIPEKTDIRLNVYNSMGQEVILLLNREQIAGDHQVLWDSRDFSGRFVPSGIYFYVLSSENKQQTGKLEIVR